MYYLKLYNLEQIKFLHNKIKIILLVYYIILLETGF